LLNPERTFGLVPIDASAAMPERFCQQLLTCNRDALENVFLGMIHGRRGWFAADEHSCPDFYCAVVKIGQRAIFG
jgi:hypothetical protein